MSSFDFIEHQLARRSQYRCFHIRPYLQGPVLVAEVLCDPDLWLDFYLVWTKDMVLSVACQDFLKVLKNKLQQLAGRWAPQT